MVILFFTQLRKLQCKINNFNKENLLELFITKEDVGDLLCIVNSSKPPGPDGISPRILKGIYISVKIPLTKLINMILVILRKLSDLWKIVQITPIFKKIKVVPKQQPIIDQYL